MVTPGRRLLVWLSLAAALAFQLGHLRSDSHLLMPVKGAAVGLLAAMLLLPPRTRECLWLAAILFFGALGDLLIESSIVLGAGCFFVGHCLAIAFYRRNRRAQPSPSQKALALALLVAVPLLAWLLPADRHLAPLAAVYALALAGMAASAWLSRYSRYNVGVGAMLFVASDLLIFARLGPLAGSIVPVLLIWPLYYLGQYMIALGVLRSLSPPPAA